MIQILKYIKQVNVYKKKYTQKQNITNNEDHTKIEKYLNLFLFNKYTYMYIQKLIQMFNLILKYKTLILNKITKHN